MNDIPEALLLGAPTLVSAARTRSAGQTARELGVTTATALRRLAAMEQELGVTLFERTPTGLTPTLALEQLLPWAEQIVSATQDMRRQVQGLEREPTGVVRLAVPPAMAPLFIVPALAQLRAQLPGITLELAAANAVVDLTRREADLALRLVRPERGELVIQRLATFELGLVCSPGLEARVRQGPLGALPWLDWDQGSGHMPEARWLREHVPQAQVVLRASELLTLLRAAQLGLGVVLAAPTLAQAMGGLVCVPAQEMPTGQLWLVAHRALRAAPRVDAVWRAIEQRFARASEEEAAAQAAPMWPVEP